MSTLASTAMAIESATPARPGSVNEPSIAAIVPNRNKALRARAITAMMPPPRYQATMITAVAPAESRSASNPRARLSLPSAGPRMLTETGSGLSLASSSPPSSTRIR